MEKLSGLNRYEQATILMVTHDSNAASFCMGYYYSNFKMTREKRILMLLAILPICYKLLCLL